jgi:hypothetical protein
MHETECQLAKWAGGAAFGGAGMVPSRSFRRADSPHGAVYTFTSRVGAERGPAAQISPCARNSVFPLPA